jgi:hypothetical protein
VNKKSDSPKGKRGRHTDADRNRFGEPDQFQPPRKSELKVASEPPGPTGLVGGSRPAGPGGSGSTSIHPGVKNERRYYDTLMAAVS